MKILVYLMTVSAVSAASKEEWDKKRKVAKIAVGKWLNGLDMAQTSYPVPKLGYSYDAFEPWIDAKTMEAHYEQIFRSRASQMNLLLKKMRNSSANAAITKLPLHDILKEENLRKVPQGLRDDLANNIGGYLNHIFYFATLSPNPEGIEHNMTNLVYDVFRRSFGHFRNFQKMFNKTALDLFGNGYTWMARVPEKRYLTIISSLEERTTFPHGMQPILGVDLWEHAYWTKYGNNREEYIRNWWKLVDLTKVEAVLNWWWSTDPFDPNFHVDL